MTQAELGKAIGDVTQTTIYRIEKGQSWPQEQNLTAILRVLQISPYELFSVPQDEGFSESRRELLDFIRRVDESKINALYGAVTQVSDTLDKIRDVARTEKRREAK